VSLSFFCIAELFLYKKNFHRIFDRRNVPLATCSKQNQPLGAPPKFGSGIAFAGAPKVDGAFENRLKEQMHYPKPTGITRSNSKVGNHY